VSPSASELRERLPGLMLRDARRLQSQLDRGRTSLEDLAREVEAAEQRVARRRSAVPDIRYPESLPVSERKDEILATIRDHQVVILAGETGSGKSTQLPKICLELGRGVQGVIGHTQPRRLAARTVAERVAEELGTDIGDVVGYTVRFTDKGGDRTLVRVMTDGILLAELQRDRLLSRYDTIIVDEAHERSLNIDFILGYLRQLLPRRPDLKVIVTSATIDTEKFAAHFGDAPIIEVSGRTYPVEIRYDPVVDDEDDAGRDQITAICDAVAALEREPPGDVLVFLSGEREIRDTAQALTDLHLKATEVLPLYARLSAAEQHRIFTPHPGRRIVLATNVAETSLTVPGIRYVVDAGTARISRYSRRTKVQRLPIEPVSQAAANQRAGRCGRVAPGICIRLYSEEDFLSRPEYTEPEILRTNLASVILQMSALGLGDVAAFPFVEPPDSRAIKDGMALLEELGALDLTQDDPRKRLTPMGRRLSEIPLDPRLARMVLGASPPDRWTACVLATLLDGRPPPGDEADVAYRLRGVDERRARDLARRVEAVPGEVDRDRLGPLLALAYPDRIGQARSGPGRFRLRGGNAAWVPPADPLAGAPFVVAADLDGKRDGARIRLGAALDEADVLAVAGDAVREHRSLGWDRDRDDLVERVARTLDRLDLGTVLRRPEPGEATTAALVDHVRRSKLAALPMAAAGSLRARVAFLRGLDPDRWPDLGDRALLRSLPEWLAPFLPGATSKHDVETADVVAALTALLPAGAAADLDRLAPEHLVLPSGRRATIDYAEEAGPAAHVRVQDLFGVTEHPAVAGGRVPVVVHLLSPAGRPVQVTSDLPGFWTGSWHQVRKELAGRYPKHAWPEDPNG